MDILDYLVTSGSEMERFDFDSADEAYAFGTKLRSNIQMEGYFEAIEVKVSNTVVRVYLNQEALQLQ